MKYYRFAVFHILRANILCSAFPSAFGSSGYEYLCSIASSRPRTKHYITYIYALFLALITTPIIL